MDGALYRILQKARGRKNSAAHFSLTKLNFGKQIQCLQCSLFFRESGVTHGGNSNARNFFPQFRVYRVGKRFLEMSNSFTWKFDIQRLPEHLVIFRPIVGSFFATRRYYIYPHRIVMYKFTAAGCPFLAHATDV